jgi:nitrate/nitrite-specific signal transduction histidine kinase
MKRIKTKMYVAIFSVFVVSFIVLMLNIGANQRIANNSQSLLKDNYPSVKYTFTMLDMLDELNSGLIHRKIKAIDSLSFDTSFSEDSLLSYFKQNLQMQQNNITETGEKEMTESLEKAFLKYENSISEKEYLKNTDSYNEKYENLRQYILSIHDLNVQLLETKNENIKSSSQSVQKTQERVGIAALAILSILIIILPMMLINPIDNLAARMMNFYKINFGKEIDLKTNHELEILEEIFEKIVLETKIGKTDLE